MRRKQHRLLEATDIGTRHITLGKTSSRKRRQLRLESLEIRRMLTGDIFGKVSEDPNANGISDPGEDRTPGWTVYLDLNRNDAFDTGEPSQITDGRGEFWFTGLTAGTYRVGEVVQPNWTPTSPTVVNARVRDDRQENISFLNFHVLIGDINGTVWNDVNGDGVRNRDTVSGAFSEPGIAGRSIFLDSNNDGALSDGEPSTITNDAGQYSFTRLSQGTYTVAQIQPAGWETTSGSTTARTVFVRADQITTVDFGNFLTQPVTISGTVFKDIDRNGVRGNSSLEPGLAGWQVFVDSNADGALSDGEPSATTDSSGAYTISGASHGTFTIRQVAQPDWIATVPSSGAISRNLLNGQVVTGVDFGNRQREESTIRGTVYFDADHDGVRGASERGLPGITVFLDANNNGALDAGEPQTITSGDQFFTPTVNEAGTYSFTHLAGGTYHVRQVLPASQSATPAEQLVHDVTLVSTETHTGVDFGNIYRPNEIHGILFNDANGNHERDADEPGVAGVTVFLDSNRSNSFDDGEPSTVTGSDGSYSFRGLTPGAYVVRYVSGPEYEHTYPGTVGGTLWPTGVSNPAQGNVSPSSLTMSLTQGETHRETVSLTLPGGGSLSNMVDVFLLFDDTGSFISNSPIVRAAFPQIISTLQASLPGVDFGFGVGRFEEYGGFATEDLTGRPFILNQPIVAAGTDGFATSIQAALDRVAPGYGGDQPETLIEALFQTVTGRGFDGNNNGTTSDSGAAGLAATQLTPGSSGDVPAFSSFTTDGANSVLPAAGTVGGAGFRAGALPIILAATDTGFAFQPRGETSITGLNGLTLPVSALTQASRPTTPFEQGAGIQETITGLNALGALVVGLGTNPEAGADPRLGLESIARLTGATNQSLTTIANGTADPIAPGDPLYFQIGTGFGSTVADGIVNAIQNGVTNVAVNIAVRASDPRVHIINHTGTLNGLGAGQTATFDVEFVGDSRPHRFDLQFVREGTDVVLGSIPVVIGTPIPGDGYEFEDLEDGEIEDHSHFGRHELAPPPVITIPAAQTVEQDTVLALSGISLDSRDGGVHQVKLDAHKGSLTLSSTAGLTFTNSGNGRTTMEFSGTLADINSALSGLIYRSKFGFVGLDTVSITASYAGSQRATATIELAVTSRSDAAIVGDLNDDGTLNNLDIRDFEIALTNAESYLGHYPGRDYEGYGDANGDGQFNNLDIQPFERLLTQSAAAAGLSATASAVPVSLAAIAASERVAAEPSIAVSTQGILEPTPATTTNEGDITAEAFAQSDWQLMRHMQAIFESLAHDRDAFADELAADLHVLATHRVLAGQLVRAGRRL